jgi:signal transduction histidine kinase
VLRPARAAERQRLAAEMHDLVTGHVTEMVLHAGALKVSARDQDVRAAAQQIRDAGSRALDELRDVIGLVRGGGEPSDRPPHRDRVPDGSGQDAGGLSALAEAAGAELVVAGDPGAISPAIARAAYRVVQEALTNARKHAPGSEITVRVRYRPEAMRIQIDNTAARTPPDPVLAASGSGTGLAGLDRRIRMLGGTLTAGPDGDGFRVTASLPATVPA